MKFYISTFKSLIHSYTNIIKHLKGAQLVGASPRSCGFLVRAPVRTKPWKVLQKFQKVPEHLQSTAEQGIKPPNAHIGPYND